ncbi:MAG: hypothetical protein GY854_29165 [Deltaproteobacteria bacterium]|nr:hypothetical protein [Deltaproteobacteria bacterium]
MESVLGPVADLILEDSSDHVQAACLDLLERVGGVVSLSEIRADGWFEQFGGKIGQFGKICDVLGERFLAYSIILGIQIRSLMVDPRYAANTSVEFTSGDEQLQTLPLAEFRIRVVQAVMQGNRLPVDPSLPLRLDDATAIIGGRNLLLAPLFDISLEQLVLASLSTEEPRALVGYFSKDGFSFIDLRDFDELLRGKVRRDLAGTAEEPFKLDLGVVETARTAFKQGDMDKVIETLETWPGLLSVLLRTPVVHSLENEQREIIGEGMELLGTAFDGRDREAWIEELFKLGLQFVREGEIAGRLYHRLGKMLIKNDRHSEAIGFLRRANALGTPEEEIIPLLGRAFLKTDKVVAGTALLEHASAREILTTEFESDLSKARERLEDANLVWNVPPIESKTE